MYRGGVDDVSSGGDRDSGAPGDRRRRGSTRADEWALGGSPAYAGAGPWRSGHRDDRLVAAIVPALVAACHIPARPLSRAVLTSVVARGSLKRGGWEIGVAVHAPDRSARAHRPGSRSPGSAEFGAWLLAFAAGLATPGQRADAQLLATLPGPAVDVEVDGTRLYVAAPSAPAWEIRLYDLADPAQPVLLSTYATTGNPLSLDAVGGILYVADGAQDPLSALGNGLRILDVSDPAAPREVGSHPTPGSANTVVVQDLLAYVADDARPPVVSAGLRIVDVANPTAPFEVGALLGFGTVLSGDVEGTLVVGGAGGAIGLADVSTPSSPVLLALIPVPGRAFQIEGTRMYVASGLSGAVPDPPLRIFDVSNPAAPSQMGSALDAWAGVGRDVAVAGVYAYLATTTGLFVFDVSDPGAPALRKELTFGYTTERNLALLGDLVLVGDSEVRIYRIDPNAPDCSDGLDNDWDGPIDGADPGCTGPADSSERADCGDGVDNDGDGLVDLADAGCAHAEDASERTDCGDGDDDDGDGLADLADPGCDDDEDLSERSPALACDDGVDNDADGPRDFYGSYPDPGCVSLTDPAEQEASLVCDNGLDDDGDGHADSHDPGCAGILDPSELHPAVACDNGIDDDGDGATDHPDDAHCASPSDRSEAPFVVVALRDAPDASPGDGLCRDAGGACTLRAAIEETNVLGGSNDVLLPSGVFALGGTLPVQAGDLTIVGPGAEQTYLDAGGTGTVLSVSGPGRVRLQGLTITGGRATDPLLGAGGVLAVDVDLELVGIAVRGNSAALVVFGAAGVRLRGGTLRVRDSAITGNVASPSRFFPVPAAGGIGIDGLSSGCGFRYPCFCLPGRLLTINSTIADNVGDGIQLDLDDAWLGCGGSAATLSHTTVTSNLGSGLRLGSSATISLRGSVLADQRSGADCDGAVLGIVSNGANLDSDGSCALDQPTDLSGHDPSLGPVSAIGSPTPVALPRLGSPLLDAIPAADCSVDQDDDPATPPVALAADQRGLARPRGAGCDIGAVESDPAGDLDGDGVFDLEDVCPLVSDPGQSDVGGIGPAAGPDGIGDSCQCGDVTGDGRVSLPDAVVIQRSLLVPPTAVMAHPSHCDVGGSPGCSLADAVTIRRALLAPAAATVQQVCAPAVP